ncbi:MAG: ThuA domain-containing protein [Acidimicrobiales bacterium]|nr:ThuA domain-containing protein [Acidimicrobiales bacterium]
MARTDAYLVCGGRYHDIDFARLELLKLLAELPDVKTRVAGDFRDTGAIAGCDLLVTYTCDVRPSPDEQEALRAWVAGGGRWLALHATNAAFEPPPSFPGTFATPRAFPVFAEVLGSQFLSHPAIAPYTVTVSDPSHPLVAGIEPFEATDELYLCEYHGDLHPLLETRWTGTTVGFEEAEWTADEPRLVMYERPLGKGAVLYLTLGHCRGRYDMQEFVPEWPVVERGSWELPVFYELLRRGLRWAARSPEPAPAGG